MKIINLKKLAKYFKSPKKKAKPRRREKRGLKVKNMWGYEIEYNPEIWYKYRTKS